MSSETPSSPAMSLTAQERAVLDLAGRRWNHSGARAEAILLQLGLSVTRYEQELNALLDRPDAYQHAPMLMKRLRRLRDVRRQARAG